MITYVKEIILHHCLTDGRLTESNFCPVCHGDISNKLVVFKAEITLSATEITGTLEPTLVNDETLDLLFNPKIREFPVEGFKVRR